MEFSLWLLFILTFSAALAIPGPNAAYAMGQTLTNGRREGLISASGFALASGANIIIVMTGLGLVLSRFVHVLIYLKWIGVCYLLFLAYKAFNAAPASPVSRVKPRGVRVFWFAVMVSLSNPKVLLANLMLLPLFIVPQESLVLQGAVITLTGTALSFLVYSAYALIASLFIAKLKTKTANRVVGTSYLCAAGALATIQK